MCRLKCIASESSELNAGFDEVSLWHARVVRWVRTGSNEVSRSMQLVFHLFVQGGRQCDQRGGTGILV